MSGMGAGRTGVNEGLIVSAFHHSLSNQAQVLLLALVVVAVVLLVGRWILGLLADPLAQDVPGEGGKEEEEEGGRGSGGGPSRTVRVTPEPPAQTVTPTRQVTPEPPARRLLQIGFGVLWLLDGALQIQAHMPLGLPENVVAPSTQGSPAWLVSTVHWGLRVWENHPVQAAVAAVWIQLGLGLWLLLVTRGRWSRIGGLVSIGWALCVWVFGESMGGILAPGASWLFGAPGAVLLYALAGALLALPERAWRSPRLGRRLLAGCGVYFVAMAVLQAWPGNGFWTGGSGNALRAMVSEMAETPQPHAFVQVLGHFGSFVAGHAVLTNALVVGALGGIGFALLSGRHRAARAAVGAALVLCLADWVLVQDFGVLGGLGTDPNSAIPTLLVMLSSYLALVPPAAAPAAVAEELALPVVANQPVLPGSASPPAVTGERPRAGGTERGLRPAARTLAVVAACATTALGAVPYAIAAASPNATTLLAESIDGSATSVPGDVRPPDVPLVEQHGRPITFGKLQGKVLLVTYLDPVCTTDCPVIAQEFKQADSLLGAEARDVDLVAINANPLYRSPADLRAFDRQERLERLPNWVYLTGSVGRLRQLWSAFGVEIGVPRGGAMVDHPNGAAIIDGAGQIRWLANFDPGPATSSTKSSFAVTLAQAARQVLNEA
jgi:cytochrome oxidase Cu insertion factor (SCO1/SenC/PrrC family)